MITDKFMKHPIYLAAALAFLISFSTAHADPDPQQKAAPDTNGLQTLASSLIGQVQTHQKDISKKASDIMKRSEEVLELQEAQAKRFGKILDTWERQQKEYQAYLDTLPKKP